MFVFIALDADGKVLAVTRTLEGIAHHAAAHATEPSVAGAPLTIEGLKATMAETGSAYISFGDATPDIVVEHHAVTI